MCDQHQLCLLEVTHVIVLNDGTERIHDYSFCAAVKNCVRKTGLWPFVQDYTVASITLTDRRSANGILASNWHKLLTKHLKT